MGKWQKVAWQKVAWQKVACKKWQILVLFATATANLLIFENQGLK